MNHDTFELDIQDVHETDEDYRFRIFGTSRLPDDTMTPAEFEEWVRAIEFHFAHMRKLRKYLVDRPVGPRRIKRAMFPANARAQSYGPVNGGTSL